MESLTQYKIIEKLKKYRKTSSFCEQIKEIGLFGSYAGGKQNKKSDIDVFLKLEPVRMFDLIDIKEDLEKLFTKKVDVVIIGKHMNRYLKKEIEEKGIYA